MNFLKRAFNLGGSELPKVAIGIPLFNEKNNIIKTLHSIRAQSYKNFVCFINDDFSNDGSYELVGDFIRDDQRFILNRQPINGGGWKNFSTTLAFLGYVANCKYSFDMGHHDLISPNYLEETISFLEANQDYSSCTGKIFSFENSIDSAIERPNTYYDFFETSGLEAFLNSANLLNDCTIYNSIFRTENLFFLDNLPFLNRPMRSPDHLVISTLAYSGKMKILNSTNFYRKTFETIDLRPSFAKRLSTEASSETLNSNFLCGYIELFEEIFISKIPREDFEHYRSVLLKDLLRRFGFDYKN
jgi:glycosyltransferase involved in cell wall biosynthesis